MIHLGRVQIWAMITCHSLINGVNGAHGLLVAKPVVVGHGLDSEYVQKIMVTQVTVLVRLQKLEIALTNSAVLTEVGHRGVDGQSVVLLVAPEVDKEKEPVLIHHPNMEETIAKDQSLTTYDAFSGHVL